VTEWRPERHSYWQHDAAVGGTASDDINAPYALHIKIHESTERYGRSTRI